MRHKKGYTFWTKERVDAGLQKFIDYFYDELGMELPASLNEYNAMIPADDKGRGKHGKYPSSNAVLRFYESFAQAWWKFGFLVEVKVKNPKYPITPEIEEMMNLIYEYKANGKTRPENVPAGAKEYAMSLGYPPEVGSKWALQLGLRQIKESPWSEKELAILDEFGYMSVHHLQLMLKKENFPRSETAIHLMRKRRMAAKAAPYYSFNSIARLLGVDGHKVKEWGEKGWLKFVMKGTKKGTETSQSGDTHLTHKDWIYQFIVKHPKEFSVKNADQLWLFHILTKGEVGLGFNLDFGPRVEARQIEKPVEHRKKKQNLQSQPKPKQELPKDLRPVTELAEDKPHGHHLKYLAGCRCDACKKAYSDFDKQYRQNQKEGKGNPLVSADTARNHINYLSENDFGYLLYLDYQSQLENPQLVEKEKTPKRKNIDSLRPVQELAVDKPHGTRLRYLAGCKCDLCRKANTQYQKEREAAQKRGEWNGLVSAEQARNHLLFLRQQGIGRRRIKELTGICETTIAAIVNGTKKHIRALNEQKILAIESEDIADGSIVDGSETKKQVEYLLNNGFTRRTLADSLGYKNTFQINPERITKANADKINTFYQGFIQQKQGVTSNV